MGSTLCYYVVINNLGRVHTETCNTHTHTQAHTNAYVRAHTHTCVQHTHTHTHTHAHTDFAGKSNLKKPGVPGFKVEF